MPMLDGHRNKSEQRKATLGEYIHPLLLPGLLPTTRGQMRTAIPGESPGSGLSK